MMNLPSACVGQINLPLYQVTNQSSSLCSNSLGALHLAGCTLQNTEKPQFPNILFAISDDQSFQPTSFEGSMFANKLAFHVVAQ